MQSNYFLKTYFFRPKIIAIIEFKICPTKITTLTYLPQKTKKIPEDSCKRQLTHHLLIIKKYEYFDNFTHSIDLRAQS